MESDDQGNEPQDEAHLDADAGAVDVVARDFSRRIVALRGQNAPGRLHEERGDVERDEHGRQLAGAQAQNLVVLERQVDQSTQRHVYEGVDPEGSEQDDDSHAAVEGARVGVVDRANAQREPREFPDPAHDQHRGKGLPVHDALNGVA